MFDDFDTFLWDAICPALTNIVVFYKIDRMVPYYSQTSTAETLLCYNVDEVIDLDDRFQHRPIHYAIQTCRSDVAQLLVNNVSRQRGSNNIENRNH